MNKPSLIQHTESFVKDFHRQDSGGHDWWHIYRVRNLALKIAMAENADLFIVELAALLHDIPDHKLNNEVEGRKSVIDFLKTQKVTEDDIRHIIKIIDEISFKGSEVKSDMQSIEGKVVQDADRLDAIGAIGIARVFAYGGHKGQAMHNPVLKPQQHHSFDHYKSAETTSINHFYEKLLLLKDRMNTETGKKLAEERHRFMLQYLDRFFDEWGLK
jgi:uncharacterized protein